MMKMRVPVQLNVATGSMSPSLNCPGISQISNWMKSDTSAIVIKKPLQCSLLDTHRLNTTVTKISKLRGPILQKSQNDGVIKTHKVCVHMSLTIFHNTICCWQMAGLSCTHLLEHNFMYWRLSTSVKHMQQNNVNKSRNVIYITYATHVALVNRQKKLNCHAKHTAECISYLCYKDILGNIQCSIIHVSFCHF